MTRFAWGFNLVVSVLAGISAKVLGLPLAFAVALALGSFVVCWLFSLWKQKP